MTEGQNLFHQLKTARDSGDFLNKHLQHQKQQSSDLQIFRKLMELLTKETVHSEKLMVEAAKAGADPKRHDPGGRRSGRVGTAPLDDAHDLQGLSSEHRVSGG